MIKGNSHQLGEVAPMAVDTRASDTGLSHDTFTAMVGQMVVQCEALLRQQLEHKATKQPLLYDQERIGRIMGETVGEEMVEGPTQPEPERVAQPEPFVRDEPEPVAAAEPVSIVESRVEEIASSVDEPGHDEYGPQSEGIGEVYEGTVKLRVDATDSFRQVIQFVEALRQKAGFRLLKLVGGFEDGVDIWVGLKAPIAINEVLMTMPGVAQVTPAHWLEQDASEPLINIRLANDPVPQNAE